MSKSLVSSDIGDGYAAGVGETVFGCAVVLTGEAAFFYFLTGFFWTAACFLAGTTGLAALAGAGVFEFVGAFFCLMPVDFCALC